MNAVFIDILIEKVSKEIGYEANLADVTYSIKVLDNVALKCKFKGYNDKLGTFIEWFVRIFSELSQKGLGENELFLINNSVEKVSKEYANQNVEISKRDSNNRLHFLLQH